MSFVNRAIVKSKRQQKREVSTTVDTSLCPANCGGVAYYASTILINRYFNRLASRNGDRIKLNIRSGKNVDGVGTGR